MNHELKKNGFLKSVLAIAAPFLTGLSAAQIWASIHVYLSNRDLAGMLRILDNAGYLIIPNRRVLPLLADFKTAFMGGLFFTFSVGLFLTIIALAISRMHHHSAGGLNSGAGRLGLFIVFSLLWVNIDGLNPLASVYFIVIPIPVFFLSGMLHKSSGTPVSKWILGGHLAVLLIIGGIGMTRITVNSFVEFRDKILLHGETGRAVVDFYYTYTLYPAQTFKSFKQKTMKACNLTLPPTFGERHRLIRLFINGNYLPVDQQPGVDIKIRLEDDHLIFQHGSSEVMQTALKAFYDDPFAIFDELSAQTDINRNFRQLTFVSILTVLFIIPYFLVYSIVRRSLKPFLNSDNKACAGALTLCLILGTVPAICFFHSAESISVETKNGTPPAMEADMEKIKAGIASGDTEEQRRALESVLRYKLDITRFIGYRSILESPVLYHRYLITRALAFSRSPAARNDIRILLEDPEMFIVYNAFDTVGRLGYRNMIPYILDRIRASDQWYVQWYAYRALKRLGWSRPYNANRYRLPET